MDATWLLCCSPSLLLIISLWKTSEWEMRLWQLRAAFPALHQGSLGVRDCVSPRVLWSKDFELDSLKLVQAVSVLWRYSEERILQCLWVLAMSNDSEDAWESDAYVGSFPPVFHPWAGIHPRPFPWLNITGSIIENVGKNEKHLMTPVRLPICMNMTWKNVLQPWTVTSSSVLPLGDALGGRACVRSQEPLRCILDRAVRYSVCWTWPAVSSWSSWFGNLSSGLRHPHSPRLWHPMHITMCSLVPA